MKKLIILVIAVVYFTIARGQQDPMYSQYMFNMLSINPAYAGNRESISLTALYRNQWSGIEGAPETMLFGADMLLNNDKVGLGLNIVKDQIGIMDNTIINTAYSYTIRKDRTTKLSFGLQAGVYQFKADYSEVKHSLVNTAYDPAFSEQVNTVKPNFGIGIFYTSKNFYLGASVPKLLDQYYSGSDDDLLASPNFYNRHFFFTTGMVFQAHIHWKIKPSVLYKMVEGAPMQLDINTNIWYKDFLSLGASYRTADAVLIMMQAQASRKLRFGYAYDITLSDLSGYAGSSHELFLRYEFARKKTTVLSPRYF